MPAVVEYSIVLAQLQTQGLKCHYFNSGAFGFPSGVVTTSRGWIGPEDGSIRAEAMPLVRNVQAPVGERLASLLGEVHRRLIPGVVLAMPKSHWAFEMDYGCATWMPDLLTDIGLDPARFFGLNNAAAIEFGDDENDLLQRFVRRLFEGLTASDFMLVFPGRATICTIHSHTQLWWTTADPGVAAGLDEIVAART
jgi:hypothetical protein